MLQALHFTWGVDWLLWGMFTLRLRLLHFSTFEYPNCVHASPLSVHGRCSRPAIFWSHTELFLPTPRHILWRSFRMEWKPTLVRYLTLVVQDQKLRRVMDELSSTRYVLLSSSLCLFGIWDRFWQVWHFNHVVGTTQTGHFIHIDSTTPSTCTSKGRINYLERTPSSVRRK